LPNLCFRTTPRIIGVGLPSVTKTGLEAAAAGTDSGSVCLPAPANHAGLAAKPSIFRSKNPTLRL